MSSLGSSRDELERLASALCDGGITREEAQRLESLATRSPEALDHLLEYLQLHAELAWMLGLVAERVVPRAPRPEEAALAAPRRKTAARWTAIAVTVAAVLLVGVIFGVAFLSGPVPRPPRLSEPTVVATLIQTLDDKWSGAVAPEGEGAELMSEQLLQLESGVAQIRFQSGARVILDGSQQEARFRLSSAKGGFLEFGRLTAWVPAKASGFIIDTPSATITDRGTEIGVVVTGQKTSEVHVLSGKVQVQPGRPSDSLTPQDVSEGSAVRVRFAGGRAQQVEKIDPLKEADFLRDLGPVERLRKLVESDDRLVHHYPFEGTGRRHKLADWESDLALEPVPMHGGGGGLDIYESGPGLDRSTSALQPFRAGYAVGVALESQADFEPPATLTVELLFELQTREAPIDEMVASAVAFSTDPPGDGALGVAADRGRPVFGPRQSVPEGADTTLLEPGHWYYVAATFEVREGQTTVNAYLAGLTEGDGQLVQVAEDLVLECTPIPGRLGIGKGFDRNGANAYPWAGRLDEIAIYGAVLDRQTLKQHLAALVDKP